MADRFGELATILEREVDVHDALIETAHAINAAVKTSEIDAVQQQVSRYDEQIFQAEKLEERRVECCRILAESLGIGRERRLDAIMERADAPAHARLGTIRASLKQKVTELAKVNTSNRVLLEEGLAAIDNTFRAVRQSTNRYAPYMRKGMQAKPAKTSAVVNRTI